MERIWLIITASDVIIVLFLQHKGYRYVEILVASLIFVIGGLITFVYWAVAWAILRPDRRLANPALAQLDMPARPE